MKCKAANTPSHEQISAQAQKKDELLLFLINVKTNQPDPGHVKKPAQTYHSAMQNHPPAVRKKKRS